MDQPYRGPNLPPIVLGQPAADPNAPAGDPWSAFPDKAPTTQGQAQSAGSDPWSSFPDTAPAGKAPGRNIGSGEAALRGLGHGITMGLSPALAGAQDAANPDIEAAAKKFGIDPETAISFLDHVAPGLKATYGAGRLAVDAITGGKESTPAQQAYSKTRQQESDADTSASEQHPYLYNGAEIAGSLAVPIPGATELKAASTAARIVKGMKSGATAGGLFGAGESIGEGKSAPEVIENAGKGVALGGTLGGVIGGVIGPKAAQAPATSGEKAAQTAADLGAPLPRGVASDSPMVQATTAKLKSYPLAGEKIGERVGATQEAAGNKINDMSNQLAGGSAERSAVDASVRPGLQNVIDSRKGDINAAYDELRNNINPDQRFKLPKLEAALKAVELTRKRAGWSNPREGLDQAWNLVEQGGGFNGVHRLRRDLREAGNPTKSHPGYDAGDFRRITSAANSDLKDIVRKASTNPNHAESLYNTAEITAGEIIENNKTLEKIINSKGEGAVSTLLRAANEKGGNLPLLRQLKATMPKQAFEQVSGVLLHELGFSPSATNKFSLKQFETNWAKVSNQAKDMLFSPEHRQWIENIAGLARHVKDADRFASTSHSADLVVLLDIVKDSALMGHDIMSTGMPGIGTAIGAGTSAALYLFTRWLASPAKAKSISAWVSAYRGLTLNQPTPARIAAFKIATRNLANNVDIPVDKIMSIVDSHIGRSGVHADDQKNN